MKIVTSNAKFVKTCFGAAAKIVEEAALVVNKDGLRMRAMDPSHVSLIDIRMPAGAFEQLDVGSECLIGVNLLEMEKLLSRAKAEEKLTVEFEEKTNRLTLGFGAPARKLAMPVIDVRPADFQMPKVNYTARVVLPCGIVQDGLKDAAIVSDNVAFEATETQLRMLAESDKGSTELVFDKDKAAKFEVSAPAKSLYNAKFLTDFLGPCPPKDAVEICLGKDLPISVAYGDAANGGSISFLLAPRVETT